MRQGAGQGQDSRREEGRDWQRRSAHSDQPTQLGKAHCRMHADKTDFAAWTAAAGLLHLDRLHVLLVLKVAALGQQAALVRDVFGVLWRPHACLARGEW